MAKQASSLDDQGRFVLEPKRCGFNYLAMLVIVRAIAIIILAIFAIIRSALISVDAVAVAFVVVACALLRHERNPGHCDARDYDISGGKMRLNLAQRKVCAGAVSYLLGAWGPRMEG